MAERVLIRHSFDIFEDQLQGLIELQLEAVHARKQKPKLGQMVQEAIDVYLTKLRLKPTSSAVGVS